MSFVHKLCKDNKCEDAFNENNCKIQGLQLKEMVENGRDLGCLYYLDSVPSGNTFDHANLAQCFVSKLSLHSMLGHPSDHALNKI